MYPNDELARVRQAERERGFGSRARGARLDRSLPKSIARAVRGRAEIVIRCEGPGDSAAIARLAELADRPVPRSPRLLGEADGSLVAVRSLLTGETIADPFSATCDVRALLALRAGQLAVRRPRLRGLLRLVTG